MVESYLIPKPYRAPGVFLQTLSGWQVMDIFSNLTREKMNEITRVKDPKN
ncbi:MAG: hypothetical protein R6U58_03505 [Bacteroidales bacterium]